METNKIEEVYILKKDLIELDEILNNWGDVTDFDTCGLKSYSLRNENLKRNIEDKLKELKNELETQLENL